MELEAGVDQTSTTETAIALPFPKAAWGRVIYALYILVLPALAFWGIEALQPEWQSGKLSDYIALLLSPEASLLFLFLLAYSVICYLLLLISPSGFLRSFVIRFGIYAGALLALQYSILAGLYLIKDSFVNFFVLLLVWIFPFVYWIVYRRAAARWTARKVNNILFILIPVALLITVVIALPNGLLFVLMAVTITAPFWSFLIALRAALWLFRHHETRFSLPRGLGLTAWLAGYAAAWRFDILKMYELYAALPKEPPNCYIATAAAHGHPRFVQSWTVPCADGKSMQVNKQLQRLKCAELALMAVLPQLHKLLRQIYDVIGTYLASRLYNSFLADAAYLLLKPWEWLAGLVLKVIVPEIDLISKKMYIH